MFAYSLQFSNARFGMKGDNPPQIIKNMAYVIAQDIQIPSAQILNQLETILKNSMIGIGDGLGLFDFTSDQISSPYITVTLLETPVLFPAVDDKVTDIVLTLISPETIGPLHLQYLSRLTRMFREPKLVQDLRSVKCSDGMMSVLCPDNRKLLVA